MGENRRPNCSASAWPVGPKMGEIASIPQGDAQGWANGRAFGPGDQRHRILLRPAVIASPLPLTSFMAVRQNRNLYCPRVAFFAAEAVCNEEFP